ncbi:AraC family transcriptional regulator [Pseudovibrio exalbescens]|uniref:helix-turn-helix domain-containing protein n=1 Tax=Pseudovibrio exalbescens TaxID=197461 RepID=UPI002367367F|nr:AraC family transcriptional regulator [Pseudovibrio exalbescens]MDD7910477.1 AraC family transcriptional regulator [Pseudovibrio exalbescens]
MAEQRNLDRLWGIIEKFRVKAAITASGGQVTPIGNFFIYDCHQTQHRKLVFLPHADSEASGAFELCKDRSLLVAASVVIGGPGSLISQALPAQVLVNLSETPDLASVADLLVEEVTVPRCGGPAVFGRLCEVVVIRLLRHAIKAGVADVGLIAGLGHPKLAQAIVAMHEAPEKSWRLETLADVAGMSRTQFATGFKEVLGKTPGAYLTEWRLAVAHLELEAGRPLKSVAARVGFASPVALSRAYRRYYGVSPRETKNEGTALEISRVA